MYYFHGGGANHGNSRYDAYRIVKEQNIMVISVAYRLGLYGFLSLKEPEKGQKYQTNFGIQDKIMAMKFSQQYAPIFGGNPSDAVISGASYGGEAVTWLLTIPGND